VGQEDSWLSPYGTVVTFIVTEKLIGAEGDSKSIVTDVILLSALSLFDVSYAVTVKYNVVTALSGTVIVSEC